MKLDIVVNPRTPNDSVAVNELGILAGARPNTSERTRRVRASLAPPSRQVVLGPVLIESNGEPHVLYDARHHARLPH